MRTPPRCAVRLIPLLGSLSRVHRVPSTCGQVTGSGSRDEKEQQHPGARLCCGSWPGLHGGEPRHMGFGKRIAQVALLCAPRLQLVGQRD